VFHRTPSICRAIVYRSILILHTFCAAPLCATQRCDRTPSICRAIVYRSILILHTFCAAPLCSTQWCDTELYTMVWYRTPYFYKAVFHRTPCIYKTLFLQDPISSRPCCVGPPRNASQESERVDFLQSSPEGERRGGVERSQRRFCTNRRGKELLEKRGLKEDTVQIGGARRGGVERSQRRYCTNRRDKERRS